MADTHGSDAAPCLPAGDLTVELEVAGLCLRLRGFPVAEEPFLPEHYPGFYRVGESAEAQLVVDCQLDDSGLLFPLPPKGDPPLVVVEEPEPSRIETRGNWHEGSFDLERGTGRVRFTSSAPLSFRMSLENFLRVAFANLLLRSDACLVHAAALVEADGRVDVYFGLSGSGKSRIVELCPERPALSDDLVVLRLDEAGALVAERVPFYGLFASTLRAEGRYAVRHLLRVEPGSRHRLASLSTALAAARLRACMPFLRADDPRPLELATRLVRAHPAETLDFADDPGFRELLG